MVGSFFSFYCWFKYGEACYSKYTPTGPYRVGYRDFIAHELGNECSIFYPALNDDSGTFEVPWMPWGYEEMKGFHEVTRY